MYNKPAATRNHYDAICKDGSCNTSAAPPFITENISRGMYPVNDALKAFLVKTEMPAWFKAIFNNENNCPPQLDRGSTAHPHKTCTDAPLQVDQRLPQRCSDWQKKKRAFGKQFSSNRTSSTSFTKRIWAWNRRALNFLVFFPQNVLLSFQRRRRRWCLVARQYERSVVCAYCRQCDLSNCR